MTYRPPKYRRSPQPILVRHVRKTINVPKTGMRLVVVSDSHSSPHPSADALIRALEPARILHAGDLGKPAVLQTFERIAPVSVVRGNMDPRQSELPDRITLTLRGPGDSTLTILLIHIALQRTRLNKAIRELAQAERAHLVVCGHSHVPLIGRDQGIALFNPGSIGPRRFSLPITFGVLDVQPTGVSIRHFCCETGEEWKPPSVAF